MDNFKRKLSEFRKRYKDNEAAYRCLFFGRDGKRCKLAAIRSHSLQKNGPLSSIAEDYHVSALGPTDPIPTSSSIELATRVSARAASRFNGFCSEHDNLLFLPIEGGTFHPTPKAALLFAIRSTAIEHSKKIQSQSFFRLLSGSANPDFLTEATAALRGAEIASEHGERRLRYLISLTRAKSLPPNFKFRFYKFERTVDFASTGSFEPRYALNYEDLFARDPLRVKWNTVNTFVGNIGSMGVAVISTLQNYHWHRTAKFVQGLPTELNDGQGFFFALSVAHCENTFAKVSWVNSLSASDYERLAQLRFEGVLNDWVRPSIYDIRLPLPVIKAKATM